MGKRQVRISQKNLAEKRTEIGHRDVQLILTDSRVFHGTVNEFSDVSLCIKDYRQRLHTFGLGEIQELVYDFETLC
ncbi:hypothetical protein I5M27_02145 [Adhaeribacter sp. BT258]|uniref:Uncharacterized protein n=1 Tax=Adhaeribacter terrigena TaxID=2793070 RepID=A0ABS1BXX2_9BACT|nr:hypothetical protein [Adhaeribacter terrigena]MBK0401766.1 hypothetical protein [Adhaeribacter terrigena]